LLDGSEDFVILACDGLWDVIPPWQAVEIVVDYVKEYGVDAHKAAKWLLSQAIELGSQDNVTVVVVFFENGPLVTSCRPPKEEPSMVFPIPIAVTPEAQAILERLDRSVRGTQDSPEPPASRATAEPDTPATDEGEADLAKTGERPATPRSAPSESGPRTPRGETPQRQDTSASRGVTPHGLVTDTDLH